jgi:hypothetical protein
MPAEQGVGANEERLPARSAEKPADRRQKRPVGLVQARTGDLAAKNPKLVPKTRSRTRKLDGPRGFLVGAQAL